MPETLSQKFIEALLVPRDRLYGLALVKGGSPGAAEAALVKAVRHAMSGGKLGDPVAAVENELRHDVPAVAVPVAEGAVLPEVFMPADVWARVAAAVQMEAAASAHPQGLSADSDLLKPDPMLAPKKRKSRVDDEPFELGSPRRAILLIVVAIVLGIAVTAYVLTRPDSQRPATSPATQGG